MTAGIQAAIAVIENEPELYAGLYFEDSENAATCRACVVGALWRTAVPPQEFKHDSFAVVATISKVYGLNVRNVVTLMSINDDSTPADRKAAVIAFLQSLLPTEENP